jgi:FkbM family methyltransferase
MPGKIFKKSIDAIFIPVRRSKTLLKHIVNHTLRKELEQMSDNGELFPMNHIHRTIRLAKKLANQDFIILDIGGGIGASLKLFSENFPENKIIVFEPVTENFKAIRQRFPAAKKIEFIKYAAGNENTEKEINIAARITSSSLLQLTSDPGSGVFNETNLGQQGVETIRIVRLDDFLEDRSVRIGIMKIDVQGYELNVLKGARTALNRTDLVVLEANNHDGYKGSAKYYEVDQFLRERGFTLYDILPSIVDNGKLKEWDMIYMNNSARCI